MAEYPSNVKNFLQLQDGVDRIVAAHPNDRGNEITAIETLIGGFGSDQAYLESLKNFLKDYKTAKIEYNSDTSITIKAGSCSFTHKTDTTKVRWRRANSDLTADWDDLDSGVETVSTWYYVYLVADASGTQFSVVISTSATIPVSLPTYYKKIGEFYNNADGDIEQVRDYGVERNIIINTGTVAHGGTIPLPTGYTQDQCRWFVSIYSAGSSGEGKYEYDSASMTCYTNDSRVVTCRGGSSLGLGNGTANYIIIGIK